MKSSKSTHWLICSAILASSAIFFIPGIANSQVMGGDNMKEMMHQMLGDVLPPGINPAMLPAPKSKGAMLLKHYCTQCHGLPGPGMRTALGWPSVIKRMNQNMQMMSSHGLTGLGRKRIEAPSESELQNLLAYLQKYAQAPINAAQYPGINTPAGKNFRKTCARCHALPDPKQRTNDEWPQVVARMKQNMIVMGKSVPKEKIMKEIITFLQHHAKKKK